MAKVYFIRHCEPDYNNHDDALRPLTEKGMRDTALVTAFLWDKDVSAVISSPFKRAYDTVADFAIKKNLSITVDGDFRERAISNEWITDFRTYSQAQWENFDYKLPHGESIRETQTRNITALRRVIAAYPEQNIAIGSHGTAISAVIQYYNNSYGYDNFCAMAHKMPWAACFTFEGEHCAAVDTYDL